MILMGVDVGVVGGMCTDTAGSSGGNEMNVTESITLMNQDVTLLKNTSFGTIHQFFELSWGDAMSHKVFFVEILFLLREKSP